jgi:hypothetical protein
VDPSGITGFEVFELGCLGGALAWVVTLALPAFREMYNKGTWDPTLFRIIGAVGILVALVAIGGAAGWGFAWGDDATTTKDAFFYGVAGESLLAGAIKTVVA